MKVRIQIDTQTFVRFWLVVIGFALAALAIYSARTGLIIIGTSLFLALALNVPVTKLSKYLPGKSRVISTAISFVAVVTIITGIVFFAVPPMVQQTAKIAQTVPTLVETAKEQSQGLNTFIETYDLQPQVDSLVNNLKDRASSLASDFGTSIVNGISSLFSFMAAALLTLVLTFLMLIEGPSWMRRVWGLYQNGHRMKQHKQIVSRMVRVVSGYVTGQLGVSALGGLAAGLFVFMVSYFSSVPSNLALPAIAVTFIFSMIPMFGATIAGTIVTLVLLLNSPIGALAYVIFFIVYQQVENNLISPAIQAKQLDLSPLAILTAVTLGLYLFGVIGGIISIPIAGMIKVAIEEYLEHAKTRRKVQEKPLHKLAKKIQKETS